jgi:PAS domain S-box-containing protein
MNKIFTAIKEQAVSDSIESFDIEALRSQTKRMLQMMESAQLMPMEIRLDAWDGESLDQLSFLFGFGQGTLSMFLDCVVSDDRLQFETDLIQSIQSQKPCDVTCRLQLKDGTTSRVRYQADYSLSTTKHSASLYGLLTDISDSSSMQEAFHEAEEKYRLIVESSTGFAILTIDLEGNVSSWNVGAERITGWKAEDIVGKSSALFFTPEDRENGGFLSELDNALNKGMAEDERWHMRADGSRFWGSGLMMPLKEKNGRNKGFLKIVRDQTEKRQEEMRTELLVAELNHRVKNTLASVQSIAQLTLLSKPEPAEFVESFTARVMALSRAQSLLTRKSWKDVFLSDVLAEALLPFKDQNQLRIQFKGDSVVLAPQQAIALNMTFHELATNAAKYGALSVNEGSLEVLWHLMDENRLSIQWHEVSKLPVTEPLNTGFGTRLIQQSITGELRGKVEFNFSHSGFRCFIEVPL